jgi:NADPH:quinone reductase-like Zn-dependent oxidoreductase
MTTHDLPKTHRALVLSSIQKDIDAKVQTVPVPQATPGGVVVKVNFASVLPYAREVYDGTRQYPMPLPYVVGSSAIARIAAVGPDAVKLAPGQLVLVDSYLRGRDDSDVSFLAGLHEGERGHCADNYVRNFSLTQREQVLQRDLRDLCMASGEIGHTQNTPKFH